MADERNKGLTGEMLQAARACQTAEEIAALAKENGMEMTEEEARSFYEKLNSANGEIAEEELDSVAGGCGGEKEIQTNSTVTMLKTGCSKCSSTTATYVGIWLFDGNWYACFTCTACGQNNKFRSGTVSLIDGVDFKMT